MVLRRLLHYYHFDYFVGDGKDLTYEGIATYLSLSVKISLCLERRKRPDLRRDCDAPSWGRELIFCLLDGKDLTYEGIATKVSPFINTYSSIRRTEKT
jgi:hypothetical protein